MRHSHGQQTRVGGHRLLAMAPTLFLLVALLVDSRAVSAEETIEVDIGAVEHLLVRGGVEVELSQGEPALLVRGSQEDLERIPYAASSRGLVLGRSRDHPQATFDNVKFRVKLPSVSEIRLQGAGMLYMRAFNVAHLQLAVDGSGDARLHDIRGDSLALRVSGSGDIQIVAAAVRDLEAVIAGAGNILLGSLQANAMDVVLQGSGDMRVQAATQVDTLELSIVGAGNVDLTDVPARRADINIVGSGDARLGNLQETLDVTILGSGNVTYAGDADRSTTILGSGRIDRRDE